MEGLEFSKRIRTMLQDCFDPITITFPGFSIQERIRRLNIECENLD